MLEAVVSSFCNFHRLPPLMSASNEHDFCGVSSVLLRRHPALLPDCGTPVVCTNTNGCYGYGDDLPKNFFVVVSWVRFHAA
jgi:hypothetical protein